MDPARKKEINAARKEKALRRVAQEHLGMETLKKQMNDSRDFRELAVWEIRAALEAAFEAGKESVNW